MNTTHKILLSLLAFLCCSLTLRAEQVSLCKQAESFYASGKFEDALHVYQQMQKQGQSAELCYNMANCYFRLDSIPQALLWYERAYMLNPSDGDIVYNLQYARSKTIDKIVPEEDMFFVRIYRSLLNNFSAEGWTIVGIVLFALCLAALCGFFFLVSITWRKVGFYSTIVLFVMVLLSNYFAYQQVQRQQNHDIAIVFSPAVSGKSSPNKAGTELFLLHEGTRVKITDTTIKDWYQVMLPDGKSGWIPASSVEKI